MSCTRSPASGRSVRVPYKSRRQVSVCGSCCEAVTCVRQARSGPACMVHGDGLACLALRMRMPNICRAESTQYDPPEGAHA